MIPIFEWLMSVIIITFIIYMIQIRLNLRRIEKLVAKLPGPPCIPFFGNLFFFINNTHEDFIYKVSEMLRKYGSEEPVRFWMGNRLIIAIFHPKDVEAVLCNQKIIDKSSLFHYFQARSAGAFSLSGEQWRKHRRLANKMFHKNLMAWYVTVFNEQGNELEKFLAKKSPAETFDISHPIMRCTLDTICRTATGVHMNLQGNGKLTFPDDLTISSEIIIERMYKPWLHYDTLFKLTSLGKEMFKCIKRIHKFTETVLSQRQQQLQNQNLKSQLNGSKKDDHEYNNKVDKLYIDNMFELAEVENLSAHEIVLSALDIIIGGADTSAISDSYALVFLGIYKDWQNIIHKELDEVFGGSDRDVSLQDIDQLVNLEMVIKELLRLYTAPHTVRLLHEDIKIDNYTFPAHAVVYISTYLAHRNPKYWSHPDSFHPEHFLPENVAARPKYSYLPFSYGPRSCPGSKYGMISMKIVLSRILRKFRIECDLKVEEMKYKPSLMLELVGGYPIRLIPRTKFYYN
ncbi:cytochrome P450 4C1-like [Lycorma delicatula]|uniref:cytochrome P450 4C1-like n=1 Tax=Lycorma delicatula TaxID=130591 RepID=UPI003F517D60